MPSFRPNWWRIQLQWINICCRISHFEQQWANGNVFSFSTTFVFAIVSKDRVIKGHGLAFVLSPTKAVELDTVQGAEVHDIDDNHVGIDINSVVSEIAASAGYFKDDGTFKNISLTSGDSMQLWVEYDSKQKRLNVTLHPVRVPKPKLPLLSLQKDLSPYFLESMYAGFTSSTGMLTASHYILAWNFKMNGTAQDIDPSRLPDVPRFKQPWIQTPKGVLTISLTTSGVTILIILSLGLWLNEILGLFSGCIKLPPRHSSCSKDFLISPPIASLSFLILARVMGPLGMAKTSSSSAGSSLSSPSLSPSAGWSMIISWLFLKRKKLLEVLEDWEVQFGPHRFAYKDLHTATKGFKDTELLGRGGFGYITSVQHRDCGEEGFSRFKTGNERVIIHRDIKPANILLDRTMNAKLGNFGLAKLCDHGIDPQTSHVAGTLGYISPELSRTGKASTSSDVFALGVVMLEITCGRKPILSRASQSEMVHTDWVLECWEKGDIMQVLDQKIEGQDYSEEQVELVLKLGLLCSHPLSAIRPNMSSVIQYLDSVAQLPHNLLDIAKARQVHGGTEISCDSCSAAPLTFTESFVSHGR
uniref:non-specific serine/threonine protein kinase n=1 Tax=Brassica oleracea var. oleracea TaxID=109376 RepID=A0A0D3APJ1_BRAOL